MKLAVWLVGMVDESREVSHLAWEDLVSSWPAAYHYIHPVDAVGDEADEFDGEEAVKALTMVDRHEKTEPGLWFESGANSRSVIWRQVEDRTRTGTWRYYVSAAQYKFWSKG